MHPACVDAVRNAKKGTKVGEAIGEQIAEQKKAAGVVKQGTRTDLTSLNIKEVGGNSNEHVIRRLARDNPALLDKIEAGELSVNAAAIQAGGL